MALKPIVLPITYKSDPKGLRKAEADLKGLVSGIGKAVAGATAAVAGIGAVSIKAFADFDSAMQQSIAIMGNVSDTMRGEMSDAARKVAKETTFSAEQAAESFYFLASAGLDAKASISAMPQVARFAQAGMFDMALATDLLTDAQSALGLTVDDATQNTENMIRVSDVLVKANTMANASVQLFSEALTNKAGAAMKAVGMDIEEGVAVLAAFADQGIKGAYAGTQFGIVLRDLQTKALDNVQAFKDAGVQVFDSAGEFRNMADIIGELEGALVGLSDAEAKTLLLGLGFSDKSVAAIMALLGTSEAIRAYEQGLIDAGGTTQEVADKQLETLSAQMQLLKSEIVDVGIEIGSFLAPAFSDLVTSIKPVIKQVGAQLVMGFKLLLPTIKQLFEFLPVLIQAFMPLIPTMISIAEMVFKIAGTLLPLFVGVLGVLLPVIEGFTAFLTQNADAVSWITVALGTFIGIVIAFNKVMMIGRLAVLAFQTVLAMTPIGAIIAGIAALTAGLVFFFTQTETGKRIWAEFTQFFHETVTAIAEGFTYWFTEVIPAVWENFVGHLITLWESLTPAFKGILNFITGLIESFINGGIRAFENYVNGIIGLVNFMIRALNRLSITIPGIGDAPDRTIGFNVAEIGRVQFGRVSIPKLADGGIVDRPTLAMIGEAGPEAVIPLSRGRGMGATINITVNAGLGADGSRIGEQIVKEIKRYERVSGPVFASA